MRMIERWEVFRQEREKTEIQNRIINLKKAMIKVWLYHQSAHRLYFDIFSKFSKLKAAKLLEFKERYYGRMLNNRFKSHLIKLGRDMEQRNRNRIRYGLMVMGVSIQAIESRKEHYIIKDFLERKEEAKRCLEIFVKFHETISIMQLKMKIILQRK